METSQHIGCFLLLTVIQVSCIPQIQISITVTEEELLPDSLIKRIKDDPGIRSQFSLDEMKGIHFQYLSSAPVWFSVDPEGDLRTTDLVDRDLICPHKVTCLVEFDLAVQPVQHFLLIKVIITIQDVNDNKPEFVPDKMSHILSETARVGTSFILPQINDPDSPEFSIHAIHLQPPTQQFEVRVSTKPDGSQQARVVLSKDLDRERTPEYHLEVVAVDGGDPPKSGTLDLTVTVADANDNHPVFDKEIYEVTIAENVSPGYSALSVHASDLDTGLNSHIVYSWSLDTAAMFGHIFSVNEATGEITVDGEVDYEEAFIIYLTVEARDLGADPIPAEAVIVVNIEDVNDNAPEILLHTLGDPGIQEAIISEEAAIGTFVARVVVNDMDTGDNGRFDCTLHEQHFSMDTLGADFVITTTGELDREDQAWYNLAINCKDFGRQPLTTILYLPVRLQDVNDNSPRFSQTSYFWQITENNHPRSIMLRVNATDADEGRNAQIEYSIQGPESKLFRIHPKTGEVKTTMSLDREVKSMYQITIVASDEGEPRRSTTAILSVEVIDANDEAPIFTQQTYIFRINENEDAETMLGFVQADDADSPEFNHHTYSLKDSTNTAFRIDMSTAQISTTQGLDRELQDVHILTVVAMDTSAPYFSCSATVSVYVMDRNDNSPYFTFPTSHNNTVYISNDSPVGSTVTVVQAHDDDASNNGDVRYEFIPLPNHEEYFVVEPYLGIVTLARSIHDIFNISFNLTVTARDSGDVPLSTSAKLYIKVDYSLSEPQGNEDSNILANVLIIGCVAGIIIVTIIVMIIICHRKQCRKRHYRFQLQTLNGLSAKEAVGLSQQSSDHLTVDIMYDTRMDKMSQRFPWQCDHQSNYVTPKKLDISGDKSRQWLKRIHCDMDGPQNTQIDLKPTNKNSDFGHRQSQIGDSSSHLEYGFIKGSHHLDGKPIQISPIHNDGRMGKNSYNTDLKTFTGKSMEYEPREYITRSLPVTKRRFQPTMLGSCRDYPAHLIESHLVSPSARKYHDNQDYAVKPYKDYHTNGSITESKYPRSSNSDSSQVKYDRTITRIVNGVKVTDLVG